MVTCPSLSLDTNSRDKALALGQPLKTHLSNPFQQTSCGTASNIPDHHNTASGALATNLLGTSEALIARTP